MKDRIVLISATSAHPTTAWLAAQAGADIYTIEKPRQSRIVRALLATLKTARRLCAQQYDVYLIESSLPILIALCVRYLLQRQITIVHYANSFGYNLLLRRHRVSWLRTRLHHFLLARVDACIAVSTLVADQIHTVFPKRVVQIAGTFISDEHFFDLSTDVVGGHDVVCVGNYFSDYDHKGLAQLVCFFDDFIDQHPGYTGTLNILGRDTELLQPLIRHTGRIKIHGFADPKPVFERSAFYVHNAHFEAAGVVVLEALAAGLLPMVTEYTGAKEHLIALGLQDALYRQGDYATFERALLCLDTLSPEERQTLSSRCRAYAREHCTQEAGRRAFLKALQEIKHATHA